MIGYVYQHAPYSTKLQGQCETYDTGIPHRELRRIPNRRIWSALVRFMQPERVCQEQRVEVALFQDPGQVGPVAQVSPFRSCAVGGVLPLSEGQMAYCEHVEAIEEDAFARSGCWWSLGWCLFCHFVTYLRWYMAQA